MKTGLKKKRYFSPKVEKIPVELKKFVRTTSGGATSTCGGCGSLFAGISGGMEKGGNKRLACI